MTQPVRNLIFALIIIGGFMGCHQAVVHEITSKDTPLDKATQPQSDLPDFAAIDPIPARKQAFFDYLTPMIRAENERLLRLRKQLDGMSISELKALAEQYGVSAADGDLADELRHHIGRVPVSLVLAQAAIESAWGTSRFARAGNNLFGQWCFTKGCGIVPKSRPSGANHEVRRFDSPQAAIRSYMHNLNSHRAYTKVRAQRSAQRSRSEELSGCYLAEGLESYSEKGSRYVNIVKSLIRTNKLEQNPSYCAPTVIAEPESTEPKPEPKNDDAA